MARRKIEIDLIRRIPDFTKVKKTNKHFRTEFWNAFNYAHYELTNSALKKEALKFLDLI